jgi:hypothetical protein
MNKIYTATGAQFVIVVDEWDAVFRERQADAEGQAAFLDFLRDLLKDKPYVALAYMTGILPIKKLARQSSLNMFEGCSMVQPMGLARYTGFTEGEVRELCQRYEMDYDDVSSWYQIELTTKGHLDVVTLKAEVNPDFDFDSTGAIEQLQGRISAELKAALSVGVRVRLVEPMSIPRSEGKAKRVIDLRGEN